MSGVLVPTIVDEPMDFTVFATSPAEMETAQRSLILWAARKIQSVKIELNDAQLQLQECVTKKWNTAGWRSMVLKLEKRATFYRKIKGALEAGYYIVPPFPIDVFAIRTNKNAPKRMDSTHRDNHDQRAALLPEGEGRYVDPKPSRLSYSDTELRTVNHQTGEKKNVPVTYYYADEFREVDFPFKLARAEIKDATVKAMGLKIFDRLGVLPRVRKPDPIVCGQILVPNKPYWREPEAITFFVAWWLDTKTL